MKYRAAVANMMPVMMTVMIYVDDNVELQSGTRGTGRIMRPRGHV